MRRFLHFIRTRIVNQRVTPAAKPQPATLRYNIENVTADADFVRIRGWAWSLLQSPEELQSSQIRITVTDADGRPVPFEKQIQSRHDVAEALFSRQLGIEAGFHLLFLSSGKLPYRLVLQDEAMRTEVTISDFEPSDCPPEPWTLGFGYEAWWKAHCVTASELQEQCTAVVPDAPLISVLVPVYRTPEVFLREMIASVQAQSYPNWELCLVDGS